MRIAIGSDHAGFALQELVKGFLEKDGHEVLDCGCFGPESVHYPVYGKQVGDSVEFGGLLGSAPVMPVNRYGCEAFVARKGRIPAPIHSFKN